MTTQTTTIVGTPTLPRVNLLPPEIAEARILKQYRLGAGGAVVLAFVAVGGLYMNAHSGVAGAKSALDTATQKTASLTSQQRGLQQQTSIKDTVASAQATLASALAPQILWSHYLQDMSVALAGNYWFTSLALTSGSSAGAAGAPVAASPTTDPAAIGGLQLQGKAVSHRDVANLLASLAKERGLSHPLFTSSSEDPDVVNGTTTRLVTFAVGASVDDTLKPPASTPAASPVSAAGTTAAGTTAAGTTAAGSSTTGSTPTTTTTPAGH